MLQLGLNELMFVGCKVDFYMGNVIIFGGEVLF